MCYYENGSISYGFILIWYKIILFSEILFKNKMDTKVVVNNYCYMQEFFPVIFNHNILFLYVKYFL